MKSRLNLWRNEQTAKFLTTLQCIMILSLKNRGGKSRRDDTLLTDGFNRRMSVNVRTLQSPEGTILCAYLKCRPFGTLMPCALFVVRRLKPTVNKGSSLRDFDAVCIGSLVRRLKPSVNKVPSLRDFRSITSS